MILPKAEIKRLIEKEDMVTGYLDLDEQLQPNGFDMTLDEVFDFDGAGIISQKEKYLPKLNKVFVNDSAGGLYTLDGLKAYAFNINETVKLPLDVCAITIQRSSIMRCGVITNIGFWDSGYNGKGYSTINILNPKGFLIHQDSRIIQMVFMKNIEPTEGYHGQYQHEGVIIKRN